MILRIVGKIVSYGGILVGVAGIVYVNALLFYLGVVCTVVGCVVHEVDEK